MTDVDQRVVQMRFDDKDFEEKARKTMSTLDKLNEKLSFDEAAKKSDAALNDIVDNVETIANKAYSIVDRIIDKIKDNVATKVVDFINDATLKPLTSGWQKYTDMTKSVGTMISQGHKMEDVTRSLDKLSFFADETSYSFNDMISNIARFTATGVNLDDATEALMGISNWAAMSGQNAQTASRAFFQLSQAMGSYMQKKDWISVMTANMDTQEFRQTALDTAVALGTLKKTANDTYVSLRAATSKGAQPFTSAEFIESLTPGKWFTSEVMVETYKKYSEAVDKIYDIYSERRDKGENVTASQVLAEVKEENRKILLQYQQLNKVDEKTAETELDKWRKIKKATADDITNYAKLHKISEELAANELNKDYVNAVSEYAKQYGKTIEQSTQELERWQEYTSSFGLKAFMNAQEARTFTDVVESVKETVSTAWLGIYEQIFGNYNEAKQIWTDMSNNLIELFAGRLWDIQDMFKQWREEGGREKLWQGLYAFGAGIKTFIESIRAAWDLLISDGDGVGKLMSITERIREAGFKFYIFIRELTQSEFFTNITTALYNIKTFVEDIFGAAYDGIRDAVPGGKIIMGLLTEFSSIFKEVTENFKLSDEAIDGLRRTFKGLTIILLKSKKTIVEVLVKIVLPILNAVFTVLGELFEVVVQITGTIGDILEYFMPLNKEGSSLVTILGFLTDLLTTIVKIVGTGITYVLKALVPLLGGIIGLVAELGNSIANLFRAKQIKMSTDSNQVFGAFAKLKKLIEDSWAPLKSFTDIIDEYRDGKGLINFLNLFADISEGIGNRLLLTIDSLVGFLQIMSDSKFGKALGYALQAIRYLVKGAMWLFNNLFIPVLKEVILELGMTIESVKGIIDERGIMGLLDLIQEVFKTGIFGKLVSTIELINGVIGGNGIARIFSKGAKALESISDYFNTAKMNQAADIILKIVAAMGILYTLLALMTFLPTENMEKMKDALLNFGIALGAVVAGVFVISSAAALAGANLLGLAAGFVGIALSIKLAFSAINDMVDLLDHVSKDKIDAALKKLEDILTEYSWVIFRVVTPLALFSMKNNGSVAGIGMIFLGMAAAIYVLLAAIERFGTEATKINDSTIETLTKFVSGIFMWLAAATALLLLVTRNSEVHGIGIAIATVGIAFAALKVVFPLIQDIIAEKDTILEGRDAISAFAIFMLTLAASMYLMVSSVRGIISGLASVIILRLYLAIVTNQIIPMIINLVKSIGELAEVFNGKFSVEGFRTAFLWIAGAIAALYLVFHAGIALLEKTFGDVNPMTFLFIGGTIIGSLVIISNLLIPAFKDLLNAIKDLDTKTILAGIAALGLMMAPLIALSIMFSTVIQSMEEILDKKSMKNLITINAGILTRTFNAAASVFQSIMFTVIGLYGFLFGILSVASNLNWDHLAQLSIVFAAQIGLILATVLPITNMWKSVTKSLEIMTKAILVTDKSGKSLKDLNTIYKKISDTITNISVVIGVITLAIGAIGLVAGLNRDVDIERFKQTIGWLTVAAVGIIAGFALMMAVMYAIFETITVGSKSGMELKVVKGAANFMQSLELMIGIVGLIFLTAAGISYMAATESTFNTERFKDVLGAISASLIGITFAVLVLVTAFTTAVYLLSAKLTYTSAGFIGTSKVITALSILIGAVGGIFAAILGLSVWVSDFKPDRMNRIIAFLQLAGGMLAAVTVALIAVIGVFVGSILFLSAKLQNGVTVFNGVQSTIRSLTITMAAVSLIFAGILGLAAWASSYEPARWWRMMETLGYLSLAFVGITAAVTGFIFLVSYAFGTFSKSVTSLSGAMNGANALRIDSVITPTVNMLIAMGGLVGVILSLGLALLPAIREMQDMDISKMLVAFGGIIVIIFEMLAGMVGMMALSKAETTISKFSSIVGILSSLASVAGPIVAMALLMKWLGDAFSKMAPIPQDVLTNLEVFMAVLGLVVLVGSILGMIAGTNPLFIAGIAAVAGLIVAIGWTAKLLAEAVEGIYGVMEKWTGLTSLMSKGTSYNAGGNLMAGMAKGITDSKDLVTDAIKDVDKAGQKQSKIDNKFGSPSKVYKQYGKWIDQGLALGIKSNTKEVVRSAEMLSSIPNDIFVDENQIASPSKVFYKNGRFIVAGLSDGMASGKSSIESTMGMISDTIGSSLEKGLSGLDLNVDIFGGKTLDEMANEFIGGLEPGSIIGKLFGLDDEERDTLTKEQYMFYDNLIKTGGSVPNEIVEMMNKTKLEGFKDASFGEKIYKKFTSSSIMEKIKSVGQVFGIGATEGATDGNVLTNITSKLTEEGGVVDTIKSAIVDGDWAEVGSDIASGIGNALVTGLSPFISKGKKLLRNFGLFGFSTAFKGVETNVNANKQSELIFSNDEFESGMLKKLNNENLKTRAEQLANQAEYFGETGWQTIFRSMDSSESINFDSIIDAIDEDETGKRLEDFLTIIFDPDNYQTIFDESNKKIVNRLTNSASEAIKALCKAWGIASPSTVMRDIYEQVGAGAIEGFDEKAPFITNAMTDAANEEMREMSLAFQGVDQLASGMGSISPSIVPMIDTSEIGSFASMMSDINSGKISASLDFTSSAAMIAAGQIELAKSIDSLERNVLASLAKGEFVKVSVENTVNESNLFDSFIEYQRREYNRSGHSM